jgi:hypothetical protein
MYKAEGDITTFWSSEKVWEEMFKVRNIFCASDVAHFTGGMQIGSVTYSVRAILMLKISSS